ncbi:carboxy-S-adenosyl-L-methionine synthase [Spirochaetota bacterium]|nr:carboxy-S-adenosyl-L-methionine synthase [Spirochaetota bacterium]
MKDELYKNYCPAAGSFKFDEETAHVFDNMVSRSIPYYKEVLRMSIETLTGHFTDLLKTHHGQAFMKNDALMWWMYDLGSATGNFLTAFAKTLASVENYPHWKDRFNLIGLDNAPAMNKQARKKYLTPLTDKSASPSTPTIPTTPTHSYPNNHIQPKFEEAELKTHTFPPQTHQHITSIVLQYTLQFIPPHHKKHLLEKIYHALISGGAVLISEKIKHSHHSLNHAFTNYYEAFKERNDYHLLEIARKRRALQNVLTELTLEDLTAILIEIGFKPPVILFKWYNFVTLLAIKP